MRPHGGGHKAAEREAALKPAEPLVVRPGPDDAKVVDLHLREIETHPVLFQPREFLGSKGDTNPDYVADLQNRIKIKGELNPMTVIKLGTDWVIVDGHHRFAAYQKLDWKKPLKCLWFDGSAREAMDQAVASSAELKLTAARADRDEQAWQRVLIGGWTREEIRKTCCVSPNLITRMNNVVDWYNDKTVRTKARYEFRKQVPNLKDASWMEANLAYLGATQEERTEEELAQALARRLRERFDGKHSLSRNPKITAMALERYDRGLPGKLQDAWGQPMSQAVKDAEALTALEKREDGTVHSVDLSSHDTALRTALRKNHKQVRHIKAENKRVRTELARRRAGGTPSDHTWAKATGTALWEPDQPF